MVRRRPSEIRVRGEVAEVHMASGRVALIDSADVGLANGYGWSINGGGYVSARRHNSTDRVLLHRLIVGAESAEKVDHISGDKLDNRRANLRACTHRENLRNMATHRGRKFSRFKGVSLRRSNPHRPWYAYIGSGNERTMLGFFATEIEAAAAYDAAALTTFGEFARLNLSH